MVRMRSSDEGSSDALRTTVADSQAPRSAPHELELPPAGYELGPTLGVGGMGEVVAARDRRFDREVAVKRMRDRGASDAMAARFLREARIQARLDHPATVPVHDLGLDEHGRPYFVMQKLTGKTLEQRLAGGEKQQRLLRALVDVALAVEFAHDKGIVHRDLKPSNIMLGNFGEVYVLDWGVARVMQDGEATDARDSAEELGEGTQTGDLLGTPGYMAPEQARGEGVGPKADVYALGAVLFEVLAGEPLHPRGTAGLSATLSTPQQRPSARRPERDIPVELDDACEAALAEDPAWRPTARELADRIQNYLDGDRDVARRRELAQRNLATARQAFASGDPEARAVAMQAAGRALALDPSAEEPAELVGRMLVEPPPVLPSALRDKLDDANRGESLERQRSATFSLLWIFGFLVLAPWLRIGSWRTLIAFYGTIAIVVVTMVLMFRGRRTPLALNMVMTIGVAIAFSRIIGPFILTPLIIAGAFVAMAGNLWFDRHRWTIVVGITLALVAPLLLEAAGVLAPTWRITPHALESMSGVLQVGGRFESIALVAAHVLMIASIASFSMGTLHRARDARSRLMVQAWHLEQMLGGRVTTGPVGALPAASGS